MIHAELIRERLLFIRHCVRELKTLGEMSPEDFRAEARNFAAAESFLRRALEAVFDIGRHILVRTGAPALAREYKSIARSLGEQGVVSAATAERLVLMAGYRNRMVHLYHQVGPDELLTIIRDDLEDIEEFVREISVWLESGTKE